MPPSQDRVINREKVYQTGNVETLILKLLNLYILGLMHVEQNLHTFKCFQNLQIAFFTLDVVAVVQKLDSAIQRINHYPANKC